MLFVELIRKKRDGGSLSASEIEAAVNGYASGEIPDYQMASFLMACLLRKLDRVETAALTEAMLNSGRSLDFSHLPAPKVDKHSTGGVGDKSSLILSPLVAAAGIYVPMISGRGLGHTGGTLDKLEAIPGFSVNLSLERFEQVLAKIGCAMIGQTAEIAPADKKLYALRDVTGCVESPYLICASIMSKKMAEGIDALVLDVKTGSGAFMKAPADAEFLAQLMVETGERMGRRTVAVLTDMDQPLGRYVGNALEVEECIRIMRGERAGSEDLVELTLELAGWMLHLGGKAADVAQGRKMADELLSNGAALAKFRELVELQGGDARVCDDLELLPRAAQTLELPATRSGFVTHMDCELTGFASLTLGGGRRRKEDDVDPSVGLVLHKKVGDPVAEGDSLATLHYNESGKLAEARAMLDKVWRIEDRPPATRPALIQKIVQR